jgi:hypothetical protein
MSRWLRGIKQSQNTRLFGDVKRRATVGEEYVGKDQFGEFVRRMEQGFTHADQRLEQGFAQVEQRFGDLRGDMRQMHAELRADMRQMRNWLIGLYGIVVFGFIGSIFVTIIKGAVAAAPVR